MIKLRPLLTEAFNLPTTTDKRCEILAQFIASLMSKQLQSKTQHINTKGDRKIVQQNIDYNLAVKYREQGKMYFKIVRHEEDTNWGTAQIRIVPFGENFPDTILYVSRVRNVADDGYVDAIDNPQEIYILIDIPMFLKDFQGSVKHLTDTVKHEVRHWVQFNQTTGLPKEKVLNRNADILGKWLKPRKSTSYYPTEQHHMRDIEFKPNVHTYAFRIKEYLNKYYPKHEWKNQFKNIITYRTDSWNESIDIIMTSLEHMKRKDPTRWKQFVKEVYLLVFK